ncbi:hypothetical protein F5Y11DRAFT_307544 [Daldinia sp. FL1419]|nr:hypothetical protein F5Y11DRAFT_307544 [Daldinia sp. FL1419]
MELTRFFFSFFFFWFYSFLQHYNFRQRYDFSMLSMSAHILFKRGGSQPLMLDSDILSSFLWYPVEWKWKLHHVAFTPLTAEDILCLVPYPIVYLE